MFQKIKNFAASHKFISGLIVLTLALGGYYGYKSLNGVSVQMQYVLAQVQKGTLVVSVSGTGQISASSQIDVKPKVSGDVVYVAVQNGQKIRAGALLAQIDTTDAQKAVKNAEFDLQSAQIALEKLKISQESNSAKSEDSITSAKDNLEQAYKNGFNNIANAFLNLPDILAGIREILYDANVGTVGRSNYGAYQDLMDQYNRQTIIPMLNRAIDGYLNSSGGYNDTLEIYKNATRNLPPDEIIALIGQTLNTAETMAQAIKDEQNILDAVVASMRQYQNSRPIPSAIAGFQSDISGYIGKLNSIIDGLTGVQSSIRTGKTSLENAKRDLNVLQISNPFDLQSQENAVEQKQIALNDAKKALANCSIQAPFGGIVSGVNVQKGDSVSSGTVVATLITEKQVAEITLNEVDIAAVKAGQKTTLAFDAVDKLTLTGNVLETDTLGTVTQGVVNYGVKIGLDAQDERVKPGMSVSADIITNVKQNVLMVPNSAVKSSSGGYYIEVPDSASTSRLANISANTSVAINPAPSQQTIRIGLSNDTMTEIVSGISEGDLVVGRVITPSSATAVQSQSTQNRNLFQSGGATRILGR